ncbi:MAG: glycerol-3-phosphate 1-O-acyltransferase PlsY [Clostridia bacterium]|nr:glycerol-3-phosphate 1-O-acyltransferase PlsY [Clostridia bacterium]
MINYIGYLLSHGFLDQSGINGLVWLIVSIVCICAAGYLLGSINSAVIVSKKLTGKDIRESGSGNPGLTNVLRVCGKKAALFTLLGDVAKTALSCLIGALVLGQTGAFYAGFASIIGHMWPVWFKFRGGKGVLSFATVVLCCSPKVFLIMLTVFFSIAAFTKYISLASVLSALLLPIVLSRFIGAGNFVMIPTVIICLLIVWKHRSNIRRLMDKNENKVHLGKNGGFLPLPLLIAISAVLVVASVLSIVFTFRTEYAVNYGDQRIRASYLRVMFIDEKNEYFKGGAQNDESDEVIMQIVEERAKRMAVLNDAAQKDNRSITSAGEAAAKGYFGNLPSLPGYKEGDTAERYCYRVYGPDVSPEDVIRIRMLRIRADEYEASVTNEKLAEIMKEAEDGIRTSEKIKKSIIDNY